MQLIPNLETMWSNIVPLFGPNTWAHGWHWDNLISLSLQTSGRQRVRSQHFFITNEKTERKHHKTTDLVFLVQANSSRLPTILATLADTPTFLEFKPSAFCQLMEWSIDERDILGRWEIFTSNLNSSLGKHSTQKQCTKRKHQQLQCGFTCSQLHLPLLADRKQMGTSASDSHDPKWCQTQTFQQQGFAESATSEATSQAASNPFDCNHETTHLGSFPGQTPLLFISYDKKCTKKMFSSGFLFLHINGDNHMTSTLVKKFRSSHYTRDLPK